MEMQPEEFKDYRCHLKARVTSDYIHARPLEEEPEDIELLGYVSSREFAD